MMRRDEDYRELPLPDPLASYDEADESRTSAANNRKKIRRSEFERVEDKRDEVLWPEPDEQL